MISELLVNELTDFEKDVTRLEKSINKAETLQVKFDVTPVEGLINQLQSFSSAEELKRNDYLHSLEQNLEKAKIYPTWAIVSFFIVVLFSCFLSFYVYKVKLESIENEKIAYKKGEETATEYINLYLSENPRALENYKKWAETK